MGIIEDVTQAEIQTLERLDLAVRGMVAVVLPDPRDARYAIFGMVMQMFVEQEKTSEEQVHEVVRLWFLSYDEARVKIARKQMHAVSSEETARKKT